MRKVYILLCLTLLIPRLVWAQYYVELNKKNTTRFDNSYLIDIPLNRSGNLFIQDPKKLIPINLYDEIRPFKDTLFVVRDAHLWKNNGLDLNTIKRITIPYFLNPNYTENPNDTLKYADARFNQYKQLRKEGTYAKGDSVLIYYIESYGSSCCPRDPKWDNKIQISDFIKTFQNKHHVKIGAGFFATRGGEEGEHAFYFTLAGLTAKQKIQFLNERKYSLLSDDEIQKESKQSYLYAPNWVVLICSKSDSIKNTLFKHAELDEPYPYVPVMPQFPGGNDVFLSKLKSVKLDPGVRGKIIIRFVVRRNGTVTDIEILRAPSDKIVKLLEEAIKNSLRWIPGKLSNGQIVSVQNAIILNNQ